MFVWDCSRLNASASELLQLETLRQLLNADMSSDICITAQNRGFTLTEVPEDYLESLEEFDDEIRDHFYEIEYLAVESDVPPPCSRDYQSESVAMECCGVWVGWTRWSGGGKHGEPGSMDKEPQILKVLSEYEVIIKKYKFARI